MEAPQKLLERLGLAAQKKLGQNFLVNRSSAEKIYAWASPPQACKVLEIGPGLGAMTEVILDHDHPLHCIEKDKGLIPYLRERFESSEHFTIHHADALTFDLASVDLKNTYVLSNLPYSVSTPILDRLFAHASLVKEMCFLMQKEMVDRLGSGPNSKTYGRLSIWAQINFEVTKGPSISPNSFYPVPEVDSCLVRFRRLETPKVPARDQKDFLKLIEKLFTQRRKMIRKTLKGELKTAPKLDESLASQRPEQLNITELYELFRRIF